MKKGVCSVDMEERLSYTLTSLHGNHGGHRLGVNILRGEEGNEWVLFSGGRDGVVRQWAMMPQNALAFQQRGNSKATPPPVSCVQQYVGHTGWVNDLVLLPSQAIMLSASNDQFIKVWRTDAMTDDERQLNPLCMATLGGHTDYVKALATGMENQTLFASAGLDGQVIFWDIQRLRSTWTNINVKHTGRDPCINESSTTPADAIDSSIYCVDVDQTCTLAAVGTTDKRIYLWDRRMKRCIGALCGHISNIRKVALSGDGTNALSCSSDGTVRKWSIGQLDCVDVFRFHDDSVWSLCADKNLQTVYTGGRDRCIYRLNPTTRAHELIARDLESPPLSIVYSMSIGALWIASTSSTIQCLPIAEDLKSLVPGGNFLESMSIPGDRGYKSHLILNNRTQILVEDDSSPSIVSLWDVLNAYQIKSFTPGKPIQEIAEEFTIYKCVSNWFFVDTSLGSIRIVLRKEDCFAGEVFASDIISSVDPMTEKRINLGHYVLCSILKRYDDNFNTKLEEESYEFPAHSEVCYSHYSKTTCIETLLFHATYISLKKHVPSLSEFPVWASDCVKRLNASFIQAEVKHIEFTLSPTTSSDESKPTLQHERRRLHAPGTMRIQTLIDFIEKEIINTSPDRVIQLLCSTKEDMILPGDVTIEAVQRFFGSSHRKDPLSLLYTTSTKDP